VALISTHAASVLTLSILVIIIAGTSAIVFLSVIGVIALARRAIRISGEARTPTLEILGIIACVLFAIAALGAGTCIGILSGTHLQ
jgi:hypothetical protein